MCPLASLGILDYFARYLGYTEIIQNPNDSKQRIALATEVLSNTYYNIWGDVNNSLVWPWDNTKTFNTIINNHNLKGIITAKDEWTLFWGKKEKFWDTITSNIQNGLPVTLFTGNASGSGWFSNHYTNVFGYETWIGISSNGELLEKQFIKARLNWNLSMSDYFYCDADILNCGQIGIITYLVIYNNSYNFKAIDFAEEFVNSNGQGQYFFYDIPTSVSLRNGQSLSTNRLRCSYIENQYLVLSPNRTNAVLAYLDINFPHNIARLSVDLSMWSSNEGASQEKIILQYFKNDNFINHVILNQTVDLPFTKDYPKNFIFLFPKTTNRIRFYAVHNSPVGNNNKGRVTLENFIVSFNQF